MLKELHVANFLSFNREQVLSLEAEPENSVSEFSDLLLSVGDQRLLKICSIYGPNGGGKSNLLKALSALSSIVNQGIIQIDSSVPESKVSFALSTKPNIEITAFFVNKHGEFGYSIVFKANKSDGLDDRYPHHPFSVSLISEELSARKFKANEWTTVFSREENGLVSSSVLTNVDLISNKTHLASGSSFLGYMGRTFFGSDGDPLPIREIISVYEEIDSIRSFSFLRSPSFLLASPFIDRVMSGCARFLSSVGIKVDRLRLEGPEQRKELVFDRIDENGHRFSLPFRQESDGTQKLTLLYFEIVRRPDPMIIVADDFDSKVHPKLLSAIIDLFRSTDNKNKQLIANSHDIINMTPEHFRRDEIYFVSRNANFESEITPLSSIVNFKGEQIRKDAKYGKQYLEGLYGADPFVEKALSWPKPNE